MSNITISSPKGGGGTINGTVDQGQGGTSPWLIKIDQTSTNADVNVTDRAARDLGKVDIASLDQYTPVSGRLPVDITSLPLPTGAATSALQTQPGVDIGDVTVNNASGASAVNIQDGGNSITVDNATLSVTGGGTESSALRVTVANDSTGVLSVDDNGSSLTVDGTVNIGTFPDNEPFNANQWGGTAVAGGSGAATSGSPRIISATDSPDVIALQIIDDWDESDRAKVNPIVGQAGVQGGAGASTATTQRVAIATDANAISGTVTANPATSYGKTITYVSVAQGAAGTTVLASASPGNKHKILGAVLTMSLAGTLKFTDGAGDLTGAMDILTSGGFVLPTNILPYQQTGTNSALNIVTTVGAAKGVVIIVTEP